MGVSIEFPKPSFIVMALTQLSSTLDYVVVPPLRGSNVALSNRARIPRVTRRVERRTKKIVSRNFYAPTCWHRCRLGPDSSLPHGWR